MTNQSSSRRLAGGPLEGARCWRSKALLLTSLVFVNVSAREADVRSKFLYVHNPAAREVVWEYEPHMHAPHFVIEDRSEAHADFANHIAELNSTETTVQPFLFIVL